jgi:hypothetical protein
VCETLAAQSKKVLVCLSQSGIFAEVKVKVDHFVRHCPDTSIKMGVFGRGDSYLVRLWLVQAVDILEMPDHKDYFLTGWKSPRFYRGQLDKQLVNCHTG